MVSINEKEKTTGSSVLAFDKTIEFNMRELCWNVYEKKTYDHGDQSEQLYNRLAFVKL